MAVIVSAAVVESRVVVLVVADRILLMPPSVLRRIQQLSSVRLSQRDKNTLLEFTKRLAPSFSLPLTLPRLSFRFPRSFLPPLFLGLFLLPPCKTFYFLSLVYRGSWMSATGSGRLVRDTLPMVL